MSMSGIQKTTRVIYNQFHTCLRMPPRCKTKRSSLTRAYQPQALVLVYSQLHISVGYFLGGKYISFGAH